MFKSQAAVLAGIAVAMASTMGALPAAAARRAPIGAAQVVPALSRAVPSSAAVIDLTAAADGTWAVTYTREGLQYQVVVTASGQAELPSVEPEPSSAPPSLSKVVFFRLVGDGLVALPGTLVSAQVQPGSSSVLVSDLVSVRGVSQTMSLTVSAKGKAPRLPAPTEQGTVAVPPVTVPQASAFLLDVLSLKVDPVVFAASLVSSGGQEVWDEEAATTLGTLTASVTAQNGTLTSLALLANRRDVLPYDSAPASTVSTASVAALQQTSGIVVGISYVKSLGLKGAWRVIVLGSSGAATSVLVDAFTNTVLHSGGSSHGVSTTVLAHLEVNLSDALSVVGQALGSEPGPAIRAYVTTLSGVSDPVWDVWYGGPGPGAYGFVDAQTGTLIGSELIILKYELNGGETPTVPLQAAANTALQKVGSGSVVSAVLNKAGDRWLVTVLAGNHEIHVSVDEITGRIVK